jgi:endogenous inhibitor of DNA gyrase (YacG/DUF329 family)
MQETPAPDRVPRCPACGAAVAWQGNLARPFCSVSCKLVDLGGWLDEAYRVAGEAVAPDSDPAPDAGRSGPG